MPRRFLSACPSPPPPPDRDLYFSAKPLPPLLLSPTTTQHPKLKRLSSSSSQTIMSTFASTSRAQQLPSHLLSSPWLRFEHSSSLSPYFETFSSTSHPDYQGDDKEEDSDEENDSPLANYRAFPITPPPVVFNLTLPPTKRALSTTSTTPSLSHSSSSSFSTQDSSSLLLTPTISRHLNLNLGLVSTSPSSSSSSAPSKLVHHQDTPRPIEPRDGYFGRSTSSVTLPPRRRKEAEGEVGRSLKRRAKVEKWQIESVVVWPSSNSRRMGIVA